MAKRFIKCLFFVLISTNIVSADYENYDHRDVSARDFSNEHTGASYANSSWFSVVANKTVFSKTYVTNYTLANFTDADLINAKFINANLNSAKFTNATLSGADFTGANLLATNFTGARHVTITGNQLRSIYNYAHKDLRGISFLGCNFSDTDFSYMQLQGTYFVNCDLTGANFFSGYVDDSTSLSGSKINYAKFPNFTNKLLYTSYSYGNKDLTGISLGLHEDNSGLDLSGQNLTEASIYGYAKNVNLKNAILVNATLGHKVVDGGILFIQIFQTRI